MRLLKSFETGRRCGIQNPRMRASVGDVTGAVLRHVPESTSVAAVTAMLRPLEEHQSNAMG